MLGVFLSALDCMYYFACEDWDQVFDKAIQIPAKDYDVEVEILAAFGPGAPLPLRTSHIIFGVYDTVLAMSHSIRFVEVLTTLSLYGRNIGSVAIRKHAILAAKTTPPTSNQNNTLTVSPVPTNSARNNPSGTITDGDDSRFSISYVYDGARINIKDILLTVLNVVVIAAQSGSDQPFQALVANSASEKCAITLSKVAAKTQADYSLVLRAMEVIVYDVILPLKVFGEMTLQLKWEGEIVAEGKIEAIPGSGQSTSESEIAR